MIAYAPIVDVPPRAPPSLQTSQGNVLPKKTPPQTTTTTGLFAGSTECSYLVMFFVFGVIALSIKDMSANR